MEDAGRLIVLDDHRPELPWTVALDCLVEWRRDEEGIYWHVSMRDFEDEGDFDPGVLKWMAVQLREVADQMDEEAG